MLGGVNLNFCKQIRYKINANNVGCDVNVYTSISWCLEQEEYVIVLEDDIIAHESFFAFAQEMLIRYKDDPRIGMVSGCNYTPISLPNNEDYCFCQMGHISGWATWKRVWEEYNLFEKIDDKFLTYEYLITVSPSNKIAKYMMNLFHWMQSNGNNNTWDYMFWYYRITRNLLSIVPRSHLTSNIGDRGVHTTSKTSVHFRQIDDSFTVMKHPEKVSWNKRYDIHHFNHWIRIPLYKRVINRVVRLFC